MANAPLWQQLSGAAQLLAQVAAGRSATAALADCEAELRPAVQALGFAALRSWGRTQALSRLLARRAPPAPVQALLCAALTLLLEGEHTLVYAAHTVVDQAVQAAKRSRASAHQAGLVNACLRRFLRERQALMVASDADLVARWNHPLWWIKALQRDYPMHWQALLQANQRSAPMTLRVNARKMPTPAYQQALAQMGLHAEQVAPHALTLQQACAANVLPGFEQGWCSVQDAAAQQAAPLLLSALAGAGTGARVLDACAAPGGKSAHLLELADLDLTALDIDAQRVQRIHENLQRLGLAARVLVGDALAPSAWWDGQAFDAILLDAPCSASGVVRRHPDARWLRRASDIAQLAAQQQRLLQALWPLLKRGGALLYCTCSLLRAEGEQVVKAFLAHNTEAVLRPSPGHLSPVTVGNEGAVPDNRPIDHDGFYYALLQKSP